MRIKTIVAAIGLSASACSQTTDSCVARGSRVKTPDGWKPIEEINVGDLVISVNEETGETESSPVVAIRSAVREVGSVSVAAGSLRLTSNHPVYDPTTGEYAPAGDWFLGQRTTLAVLADSFQPEAIESVSTFVETTEVFDIEVASDLHNFVANGILVHNKSIAYGCDDENGVYQTEGSDCTLDEDCNEPRFTCTDVNGTETAVCVCADSCEDQSGNRFMPGDPCSIAGCTVATYECSEAALSRAECVCRDAIGLDMGTSDTGSD